MKKIIKLEEAASRLNKSRRTIYDYVEKGILKPVAERPMSGGLVFYEEDIAELERLFNQRLTINAAAKQLNVPFPFLKNWLEDKGIEYEMEAAGTKTRFFIDQDRLKQYAELIKADYEKIKGKKRKPAGLGRELSLYKNGLRLFDHISLGAGSHGTIIDLDPFTVLTENGDKILPEKWDISSAPCKDLPYSAYKGHSTFVFRNVQANDKKEIRVLGKLVYHFGTKNIRVFEENGVYTAICRNGKVSLKDISLEEIEPFLIEGDVWVDGEFLT